MENPNIKTHQYLESLIHQSVADVEIQGRLVPKGYVSATNILAIASELTGKQKQWTKYFKADSTQGFLEEFSNDLGQPILNNFKVPYGTSAQPQVLQPLIVVIKGGDIRLTGTWVHLEIALHLCQWASPKVAVWANRTLRLVLQGDFVALTEEAKKAERAEAIAAYRTTLFGGLSNGEYVELATECRIEHQALNR
jgi:KilA-N domain